MVNNARDRQMSFVPEARRSLHKCVDREGEVHDHLVVAEYALVTMVMASLAVSISSIAEPRLATGLPVTAARAQALVTKTARASGVSVVDARRTLARAPYPRAALRYLYAAGWIGGRKAPTECVLAKVTGRSTERRLADEIRKDRTLVSRLRRMGVSVDQAVAVLKRGTAAAC